jgi:hypothetical protein
MGPGFSWSGASTYDDFQFMKRRGKAYIRNPDRARSQRKQIGPKQVTQTLEIRTPRSKNPLPKRENSASGTSSRD